MPERRTRTQLIRFFEEEIPFNTWLGLRVQVLTDGVCEVYVPFRDHLIGDPTRPAVHGGVISTLADTCGGLAVFSLAGSDQSVSTVDLRVDFLRPGQAELDLVARSEVLRMGNRVAVTETTVYQTDPDLPIAKAAAVYNVVRQTKV